MSYDEMWAELEGNGYQFGSGLTQVYVHLPDGSTFRATNGNDVIDYAWQHYQREKKYKAMESLLKELYHGYVDSEPNYEITPLEPFNDWLDRCKQVLGE
jgi:hypothetical protein